MAVAEAPFDLLDVKLAAPVARPDTVAKAELIARLCTSREPVVTVVAGAGYGKTTLLARWDAADARPFAWVALDGREDEVVLLRYVAAAIHSVEPVPEVVLEALSGPRGSIWSTRVPRLISALAALERPMVLVLDDLHAVSRPSCIDVLAALLEYVPAGSQVAIVEQGGACIAARPLAGAGSGPRDRRDRAPAGRPRGRTAAEGRGHRPRWRRARRADRAHRGLARRSLPRGAVAAGGCESGTHHGRRGRRPLRLRLLPARAAVPATTRAGALPQVHVGPGAHERRPLRCGAGDGGIGK